MLTAYPLHCITLANTIEQSILKETNNNNNNNNTTIKSNHGLSNIDENDQKNDITLQTDNNNINTSNNNNGSGFRNITQRFRSQPLKYKYKALLRVLIVIFCAGLALLSWNFDCIII